MGREGGRGQGMQKKEPKMEPKKQFSIINSLHVQFGGFNSRRGARVGKVLGFGIWVKKESEE